MFSFFRRKQPNSSSQPTQPHSAPVLSDNVPHVKRSKLPPNEAIEPTFKAWQEKGDFSSFGLNLISVYRRRNRLFTIAPSGCFGTCSRFCVWHRWKLSYFSLEFFSRFPHQIFFWNERYGSGRMVQIYESTVFWETGRIWRSISQDVLVVCSKVFGVNSKLGKNGIFLELELINQFIRSGKVKQDPQIVNQWMNWIWVSKVMTLGISNTKFWYFFFLVSYELLILKTD